MQASLASAPARPNADGGAARARKRPMLATLFSRALPGGRVAAKDAATPRRVTPWRAAAGASTPEEREEMLRRDAARYPNPHAGVVSSYVDAHVAAAGKRAHLTSRVVPVQSPD